MTLKIIKLGPIEKQIVATRIELECASKIAKKPLKKLSDMIKLHVVKNSHDIIRGMGRNPHDIERCLDNLAQKLKDKSADIDGKKRVMLNEIKGNVLPESVRNEFCVLGYKLTKVIGKQVAANLDFDTISITRSNIKSDLDVLCGELKHLNNQRGTAVCRSRSVDHIRNEVGGELNDAAHDLNRSKSIEDELAPMTKQLNEIKSNKIHYNIINLLSIQNKLENEEVNLSNDIINLVKWERKLKDEMVQIKDMAKRNNISLDISS
ncbi:hypothetical protein WN53_18190 [Serratia fonticola]|uniref:hypothetical protein n=1 Tax=Serratia fonticola TaxID=47917 RepID=UPI000462EA8A|nr:hypothetical protein [Serratia fonticola]AKG70899.1 hypothetical protein WN53_18190 [Serratia fonticola]CAI1688755.1 Uncharacterised protein [Serratia fonticola]